MPTSAQATRGKKGQRSRERLLAAAASEFAHTGYHDTKVSAIVARAGLTQAAFYRYFPSKRAIFDELIADLRHRVGLIARVARLSPGLGVQDLPGRIQSTMEMAFRFLQENADLVSVGLFIAPEAEEIKAEIVAAVAENMRVERDAGYIRSSIAIDVIAESVVSIILRLTQSHLIPGKASASDLGAQTANLIMHGIFNLPYRPVTDEADTTREKDSTT